MDAAIVAPQNEAALLLRRLVDATNLAMLQRPGPGGGPFWDPRAAEHIAAQAPDLDAAIIRLFLGGMDEPLARLAPLLGDAAITQLENADVLQIADGAARSRLLLASFLNRHVFAAPPPGHPRFSRDIVPYCGPESLWYGRLLAGRGPYSRHLDLCTGSGLMALLPEADETVAIDLDPAAIPVARFNLALNLRSNIALRTGDLFAPVAGERFDLVTANPPFLPQGPGGELPLCGAGGTTGGEVPLRILSAAPEHLTRTGEALIYCEGFGDASGPALARSVEAVRSPAHDYIGWIGSIAGADRSIFGLVSLWCAAGADEAEAWAHWASLARTMPASHYYTMVWQVRPGRGTLSIRQMGPR
jgi:hypothetical protein